MRLHARYYTACRRLSALPLQLTHYMLHPYFRRLALVFSLCALGALGHASALAQTPAPTPPGGTVPLPEPSASARELFSRYKDRLLQVRVLLNSASEQSALGSGFVVREDADRSAWVLTNYHVVSELAIEPERYRIELRGTNERNVPARLVAVDVIHDLAVLRTEPAAGAKDTPKWNVFALREAPLAQGTKIFSLGNPLELGFLISEGIYNGFVEARIYEQMLFSGALNSGMSGGPAIDEGGQVVGVNVAARRDGELLSFLVPVRYARDLLARATAASGQAAPTEWRKEIARQLLQHQEFVAGKLLAGASAPANNNARAGFASQTLAGRTVPTLDGSLTKCWARGRDGDKLRYQRDSLDCNLRADLFVRGSFYTGTMSLRHAVLRNEKLATPQFLGLGGTGGAPFSFFGTRGERTPPKCSDDYVQAAKHVYRVAVCVRAYRKFEGVYDYSVSATQVDDARERQSSSLDLRGFSFENAQALSRMFLERLQ
jgi:serine protease Do